jgi:hypothetical protein
MRKVEKRHTRSNLVDLTNNVGHTGLVTEEGGKMDWLGGIITRESLDCDDGNGDGCTKRHGQSLFTLAAIGGCAAKR